MDEHRRQRLSSKLAGFRLPPGISISKQVVARGYAYLFRDNGLGVLGRMVLQETADGRTHIACEVAGDAEDPMTAQRRAVFEPLSRRITELMDGGGGGAPDAGWAQPPGPLAAEPTELVESRVLSCERCGVKLAMLIFAPGATDVGRFEDYARKMYREYTRLNVQTWIIGPALGGGPMMDRPAEFLKLWLIACTPEANHGKAPLETFVIQLKEALAEWRRRRDGSAEF